MPTRWIPFVKVLVHAVCLLPFLGNVWQFESGALGLQADPVQLLTHYSGDWALWLLLASLAITPLRRLHPKLGNLIRFRRMLGLYAFFYATLHLSIYIFLFSGYDLPTALKAVRAGHLGVVIQEWKAVWPTILDDLKKRRFIQVGLLGWVILFVLALTSPGFMLRAMGGRNWQRLHRLVYVAAIAAVVHYWWLVKAGVRSPLVDTLILAAFLLARVIWTAMKRRRAMVPPPAPMRAA